MSLAPGSRIGSYEVRSSIGAGGMGEVYLATDTRLHRDVALKIVSEIFEADREHLARFEREAQVLASLNHPNIAHIYGLEQKDAVHALVMEFVPGRTLSGLLPAAGGGMPIDEALSIARQIADGLEAAHERGIVHRDLKPANVMLTDDDRVKILDFGLARVAESSGDANLRNSPTVTGATRAGVILGTAAYMSPEQAKGRTADKRSDVWSFGCVLYELLTGTSPFAGETVTETLANVLKGEPDWSRLPATLPPAVRTCLEGCFRRDRHDRIGDMSTVKFLLSLPPGPGTGNVIAATTAGRGPARERAVWLACAVTLAAVTGLVVWRMRPAPVDAGATTRFPVVLPEGQEFGPGPRRTVISPDGKKIVYVANRQLYLRQMADPEARPIPGSAEDPITPVFSPDGEWIAYVDRSRSRIKKLPVAGGAPVTVAELPAAPSELTWGAGRIAFGLTSGESSGIQAVSDSGGAVKQLISVDPRTEIASQPQLVGDTHVLFTVRRLQLASAVGGNSIVLQEINGGARSTLVENGTYGRVLENGLLAYLSQGSLRAVTFDNQRLATTGSPVVLVPGVAGFTVARNGTLVYNSADYASRAPVWVNRKGVEQSIRLAPSGYFDVRMSPDGTRIAMSSGGDIWIWTIDGEALTRLTFTPDALEYNPLWTRDGRHVLFDSSDGGGRRIFRKSADGSGSTSEVAPAPGYPETITSDGRLLVYHTQTNIAMLQPLDPVAPPRPLVSTRGQTLNAEISPDGRWIAYQSDESGRFEIYVQPFPAMESGRWQVSLSGGVTPLWAPRSGELFFIDGAGTLVSVPVRTSGGFIHGRPTEMFSVAQYFVNVARNYDISPDGSRFVFVKTIVQDRVRPSFSVVTDWFEEVRARMRTAAQP